MHRFDYTIALTIKGVRDKEIVCVCVCARYKHDYCSCYVIHNPARAMPKKNVVVNF